MVIDIDETAIALFGGFKYWGERVGYVGGYSTYL